MTDATWRSDEGDGLNGGISAREVCFRYRSGGFAVEVAEFVPEPGIHYLVGRNGSGKSTFAQILGHRAEDGRVQLGPGVPVADLTGEVADHVGGSNAEQVLRTTRQPARRRHERATGPMSAGGHVTKHVCLAATLHWL